MICLGMWPGETTNTTSNTNSTSSPCHLEENSTYFFNYKTEQCSLTYPLVQAGMRTPTDIHHYNYHRHFPMQIIS